MNRKLKRKITVKVLRTGGDTIEITIPEGSTVADALDEAGMHKKDTESIRVNSKDADAEKVLKTGDRVVLTKNIQGGLN